MEIWFWLAYPGVFCFLFVPYCYIVYRPGFSDNTGCDNVAWHSDRNNVGGVLGWKGVILTTFLGSLSGAIVGVLVILFKGKEKGSRIPFGPFLALGSVITLFYGQEIFYWYLGR